MNRAEKVKEIIDIINDRWQELTQQFYVCYSVKELAYRMASKILQEYYSDKIEDITTVIYCKKISNKWKIAIPFEYNVFFIFDIWWATGMFGDTGLHVSNGIIYGKLPKGYEDIEYVLEDEEKIKQLQEQIKKKVYQYVNAQKRYNGDSALSKRLEAEVDSLEIQIKMLKGTI